VKGRPKGAWIVGRGWHEGKWETPPKRLVRGFPPHDALSEVSPDNPVYLTRADGHAGFANAQAMALMKITKDTKPPAGGDVIRDESGQATGVFIDAAQRLIQPPDPTEADIREAIRLATQECLRKGITFIDDAGADLKTIALYEELAAKNQLGLRVYAMIRGLDSLKKFGPPRPGGPDSFLSVRSVKLVIDGALGSRGARLLEPYVDDPAIPDCGSPIPQWCARPRSMESSMGSRSMCTRSATRAIARFSMPSSGLQSASREEGRALP